jgi:hypothetical protein
MMAPLVQYGARVCLREKVMQRIMHILHDTSTPLLTCTHEYTPADLRDLLQSVHIPKEKVLIHGLRPNCFVCLVLGAISCCYMS